MKKNKNLNKTNVRIDAIYACPEFTQAPMVPLLAANVPAGFPSVAENFLEKTLDLNELLIHHPAATFFIRVTGNSMQSAGINSQDILIVDRAISPTHNKIVVARIHDEFTVKRICIKHNKLFLMPDNEHDDQYKPIEITSDMDFEIWGVVRYVIHQL